jgi:hypothetical protein
MMVAAMAGIRTHPEDAPDAAALIAYADAALCDAKPLARARIQAACNCTRRTDRWFRAATGGRMLTGRETRACHFLRTCAVWDSPGIPF